MTPQKNCILTKFCPKKKDGSNFRMYKFNNYSIFTFANLEFATN